MLYRHIDCLNMWLFSVCAYMETNYQENDVIQPNCSTRCICQNGIFVCEHQLCTIDGATCQAFGDPHYYTFDSNYFNFQGTCEYVLTQSCNTEEFAVIVTNSAHNQYVSCTDTVRVVVPNENLNILLGRGGGGTVTINDILQPNNGDEIILRSGEVEVVRVGGHPHVILSAIGVRVSWDGLYHAEVTVSTSWSGRLCGLCGNYNSNPNDDFQTPNGHLTSSANDFGLSWVLNNGTHDNCGGLLAPNPCPADVMTEAQARCSMLNGGYFNSCNDLVNPASFINSCIFDYCHCNINDREDCYCNSLSAYVGACAHLGINLLDWRSNFCCKFSKLKICISIVLHKFCSALMVIFLLSIFAFYPYCTFSCRVSTRDGISAVWSIVSSNM